MRKYKVLFIIPLLMGGCVSRGTFNELKAPQPPFKGIESQQAGIVTNAAIAGREIVKGNKKLIVNPGGSLVFMNDGKQVCEIYFHINTDYCCWLINRENGGAVPRRWSWGGYVGIDASAVNLENKEFQIAGSFPLLKEMENAPAETQVKFIETVKLGDDGLISVRYDYDIPSKYSKSFKGTCVFIALNSALYDNQEFAVDNKRDVIPGHDKADFFVMQNPGAIAFAPGNDAKGFGLSVKTPATLSADRNNGALNFRLYPQRGTGEKFSLEFILDLGQSFVKKNDKKDVICGGIDYKKTDDLEMPDSGHCRNLMLNPSFEQGLMYCIARAHGEEFRGIDDIEADGREVLFGKHSLKIKPGWGTIMLSPVPVNAGTYTFSFYAKTDNPTQQVISAWLRSSEWIRLNKDQRLNISNEWRRYSTTVETRKPLIISPALYVECAPGGHIWIDGVQLEEGGRPSDFIAPPVEGFLLTSRSDNFLGVEDKIGARLRITSWKPGAAGKVKIAVKNFYGEVVYEDTFKFKTGTDSLCEIPLPLDGRLSQGIYVVKAEYVLSDGTECRDLFRFSVMALIGKTPPLGSLFANSYSGSRIMPVYPGVETYLKRCAKVGIFGVTHAGKVSAEMAELYKKYDIDIINCHLAEILSDDSGRRITYDGNKTAFALYAGIPFGKDVLIKDFRVEGDGTLTDDYLKRFKAVVAAEVRKYPWIPRWSFAGEDEAKWPEWLSKDPESYARINIAFYEAVKSANPKLSVYNGPPCNFRPEDGIKTIENILAQLHGRIKFDALTCHTYMPDGPYSLDASIETMLSMAAKYGYKDTPVFFPEGMHYGPYNIPQLGIKSLSWGPPATWFYGTLSYDLGWTEKISAAWFARNWLIMMKHRDRIVSATSSALGMISNFHLDSQLTPRAYQKVPNTLCNLLGNARFIRDVSFAPETRCLVFEDENLCPIAVLWSEFTDVDQGLEESPWASAKFGADQPKIFDLMQTQRTFKEDAGGRIGFPLAPFPIFIKGARGTTVNFCEILGNARIQSGNVIPLKLTGRIISPESLELTVANLISRQVSGTLKAGKSQKELSLTPFEKTNYTVELPARIKADEIKKVKMPVTLNEKDGKPLKKEFDFEGFLCLKAKTPKSIDGGMEDWADTPEVHFKNRCFTRPEAAAAVKEEDFSGYFKSAWDADFLYLAVVIKDDVFQHNEYAETAERYNNDSLQIFIDTCADARDRNTYGYDNNDYDYAVFPDKEGKNSIVFRYKSPDRQLTLGTEAPPDRVVEPNIPSVFRKTPDGYVYEVKFPAKYLRPAKLEKGYSMSFSLFVNDRDDEKGEKQALTLTPQGTGGYNRPNLYPVMLLAE